MCRPRQGGDSQQACRHGAEVAQGQEQGKRATSWRPGLVTRAHDPGEER